MHIWRKAVASLCAAIILSGVFSIQTLAYWDTTTMYGSKTISLSSASQSQSKSVTLPSGSTAYYVTTDNGSVSYSQSGDTVTTNASGGTGTTTSTQQWNPYKYSKTATYTVGPQSSQYFPSTYSYNDGTYSGTISQNGSAYVASGQASSSKTAYYDYTYTYSDTATIIKIEDGTITFSWSWPSVPSSHYYSDGQGYSGYLSFTGYGNATHVSNTFNFPAPNYIGQTSSGTATHIFHYSGTVSTPDTRQWKMNYRGTVYAGGYDTIWSTVYNYNVTVYYYTVSSVWISDTTPPDGSASISPAGVTSGNVTINIAATDSGSGVKSITKPDRSVVNSSSASYTVSQNGTYNFILADNDGNQKTFPVTVTNIDRTITVTHTINVTYSINPNNATTFSCPDITITNNSRIKVQVSVQQFKVAAGGSILLNDVSPTKYSDWSKLTAAQTKSDIALGFRVKEIATGTSTWYSILNSSTLYAANISSKTQLGILNSSGVGTLAFTANCGLAWDRTYTSAHELVLVFDAY